MVKKHHKLVSLILCLLLAVSAVCAGTVGAFAASGDTVYVKVNNGWANVNCYMWTDNAGNNANWPGVQMTKVEDDVYSYTLTGDFEKVIFNNGSAQTADLTYAGNGKIYDLSTGTWSTYVDVPTNPTSATTATTATTATSATTAPVTTPSGDGITVYCDNEAGWAEVKCYMWNSSNDTNAGWPGVAMTNIGGNVYQYTAPKDFANCIFSGGGQTGDLSIVGKDGYIYNNKTNTWSIYDTSPLQVTSFTTDPAGSSVYVNGDVTVSATANSKTGSTVSYKFSVENPNGTTSVLSDFGTVNSTVWTPTVVGDYTLVYDFKDTDGNTNSRTLDVTVADDSTLVKPVIKSVLPSTINLIQTNKATTVYVKAGGGKTGTNLLFYKYVVTDPNKVKNTPYYTLNNTYSFTPTMVGEYTVNVYVQGSDNSTVTKTYKYTATNVPVPSVTVPTTPTTPTQPTTAVVPTTKPVVPTTVVVPTTNPVVPTTTVVVPTTTPVVKGDADGDGRMTIKDVTYIQKALAEYDGYVVTVETCDMDGDGRVSIKDSTLIQKALIGI